MSRAAVAACARLALSVAVIGGPMFVAAHDATSPADNGVSSTVVSQTKLANAPGQTLTVVALRLAAGATIPAHHHAGTVVAYVTEGTVLSQLNDAAPSEYSEGMSWVEPPGTTHTLMSNPSRKYAARVVAIFVAPDAATLTEPGAAAR